MSAKGALGPTLQKFCLEYVLCKTKQKVQSAIFQQYQKFCKTLRLFLYNLRLSKGCVYRLKGKTLRKICTTQAHLHRCTLLQLPIREKRFENSFFRYVTTFLLLCIACYVQKQNQKNCTFIPSYAKNAVVTFIGSFAKGRQKNAVHCDTRQNVQKKCLRRAKTVTHSQKAKENPRKRGFS